MTELTKEIVTENSEFLQPGTILKQQYQIQKIFPLLLSLEKMHERGVIHQDISADNLMITEQGKFKLIDFGSAGILKEPGTEDRKMQVRRGFAKEQAAIIMKGLALDREKRIQTVKELREELSKNTAKTMR